MKLKISVALCTYNGEKYIREQLDSILKQTVLPDEIVIFDDCSTDNTVEIIKTYIRESHITWKLSVNQKNLGYIGNFDQAIRKCSGDIIFPSDQDDVWLENKIEKMVSIFYQKPDHKLVFSNAYITDDNLNIQKSDLWKIRHLKFKTPSLSPYVIVKMILKTLNIHGCTMAFKRELYTYTEAIPKYWAHDSWATVLVSLFDHSYSYALSDKLILYRQHNSNLYGAKPISMLDRLNRFLNFSNNQKFKYLAIQNLLLYINNKNNLIKNEEYHLLKECHSFLEKQSSWHNKSKILVMLDIIIELFKGSYHRHYTGFRAVIKDIFYYIFFNKTQDLK